MKIDKKYWLLARRAFWWFWALVVLWMAIRVLSVVLIYSTFHTPTSSMMPTFHPGDRLIVWKYKIGARIFDVFSAREGKDVNIYRLPGLRSVERNDILVFNYPYPKSNDSISFDVYRYYVKRCVALSGDSFCIRQGMFVVNGVQGKYGNVNAQQRMRRYCQDTVLVKQIAHRNALHYDDTLRWKIDELGPLYVPKAGDTLLIDKKHYTLYCKMIAWESGCTVAFKDGMLYLDNHPQRQYVFRENYYFMAGDNVFDSRDSRYWGLVPEPFIVGVANKI